MKRLIALATFVTVSALAPAQTSLQDFLKGESLIGTGVQILGGALRSQQGQREQVKVGRENLRINADQPTILFRGEPVVVRLLENAMEFGARDDDVECLMQTKQALTALGATVSFDGEELQMLTEYFDQVNDSKYVDARTKFQLGSLKAPRIMVEVSTTMIESTSDLEGFWGRLFKGFSFELDRSTSYAGITFAVRPLVGEYAGTVVATYRIIGRSSTTDRLEVSLWDSLFGAGLSSDADEGEKRNANAAGDAFKQLRGLLGEKAKAFR